MPLHSYAATGDLYALRRQIILGDWIVYDRTNSTWILSDWGLYLNIVAYLFKARTVKPVETAVARERL
jgi:hypothetical protein